MDCDHVVIIPTYGALDYAREALRTLWETAPRAVAVVIDDASPDWHEQWLEGLEGEKLLHRFEANGGLTRSWNKGLEMALATGRRYLTVGNNDILFTPGWYHGLEDALKCYRLVGPVSNAPGDTAGHRQNIRRYIEDYQLTDDEAYLAEVAACLRRTYAGQAAPGPVNGFFMTAEAATWDQGRFAKGACFRPVNYYNLSGCPNPTPYMTANEDELQARWRRNRWYAATVPSSFIFHYRSVSRGIRYAKPGWYRRQEQVQT